MPCHIVKAEPLYHGLKPAKHGFCVHELLGHAEKENPATFGIWSIDAGNPITYNKLPYHGFVAVTEGELLVEDLDEKTEPVTMHAGDLLHVTVGTSLRWHTPTKCKGVYVHLKALGDSVFVDNLE
ncbi:hypothetical protein F5I97DRAFT_25736 [Phlebopus sp. FC_14]|nr:hypothetical protein F5I97DRAFT_25736 [Phlebopus sp. FC_14]